MLRWDKEDGIASSHFLASRREDGVQKQENQTMCFRALPLRYVRGIQSLRLLAAGVRTMKIRRHESVAGFKLILENKDGTRNPRIVKEVSSLKLLKLVTA